jgi:hypothetical protein
LADFEAYDSNETVEHAQDGGVEVVITPKANRKQPRALDKDRYKARHLVENLDCMFLCFVHLAAIKKWLH